MDRYTALTTTHHDEMGCFTETSISPPLPAHEVNNVVSNTQNRVRQDDNLNPNALVAHESTTTITDGKPLSILRVAMVHAKPCEAYDIPATRSAALYRKRHFHNVDTARAVAGYVGIAMRKSNLSVTSTP